MTSLSRFSFRDLNEQEFYEERLAEIVNDDRLDEEEARKCAWGAVLRRREYDE